MSDHETPFVLNPDQGLAFIEALTGVDNGRPKSPHARTILAAMLGQTSVPMAGDIVAWHNRKSVQGYPQRLTRTVQYLRAVADSLEQMLPQEDRA